MERQAPPPGDKESGFTLIETMIAGLILVVGLLSLAYAYMAGMAVVMTGQQDTTARQKAREAMENVFSARDNSTLAFSQLCNVGNGSSCIFINGFEPLYQAGPDGMFNTSDDGTGCASTPCYEQVWTPGPDGILGTADDVQVSLLGFQRQIQITQITSILVQITVTIQYTTPKGATRSVTATAVMSPYV